MSICCSCCVGGTIIETGTRSWAVSSNYCRDRLTAWRLRSRSGPVSTRAGGSGSSITAPASYREFWLERHSVSHLAPGRCGQCWGRHAGTRRLGKPRLMQPGDVRALLPTLMHHDRPRVRGIESEHGRGGRRDGRGPWRRVAVDSDGSRRYIKDGWRAGAGGPTLRAFLSVSSSSLLLNLQSLSPWSSCARWTTGLSTLSACLVRASRSPLPSEQSSAPPSPFTFPFPVWSWSISQQLHPSATRQPILHTPHTHSRNG